MQSLGHWLISRASSQSTFARQVEAPKSFRENVSGSCVGVDCLVSGTSPVACGVEQMEVRFAQDSFCSYHSLHWSFPLFHEWRGADLHLRSDVSETWTSKDYAGMFRTLARMSMEDTLTLFLNVHLGVSQSWGSSSRLWFCLKWHKLFLYQLLSLGNVFSNVIVGMGGCSFQGPIVDGLVSDMSFRVNGMTGDCWFFITVKSMVLSDLCIHSLFRTVHLFLRHIIKCSWLWQGWESLIHDTAHWHKQQLVFALWTFKNTQAVKEKTRSN